MRYLLHSIWACILIVSVWLIASLTDQVSQFHLDQTAERVLTRTPIQGRNIVCADLKGREWRVCMNVEYK